VLICASSLQWVSAAVPLAVGQAQYSDRNSAQGDANQENPSAATGFKPGHSALDDIYREEGRCLTGPEIRDGKDSAISCYCRDAILDVRYVYLNYFLPGKDNNFSGIVLTLQEHASAMCGKHYDVYGATTTKDWKWNGPEVVRTYPSDNVIERIRPEMKDGKSVGRWVPFTLQLIYRDAQGRVTRTENYASREFDPVFPDKQ